MAAQYVILRKLIDGEIIPIANPRDLAEARKMVDSLREYWPAEYFIRDPYGVIQAVSSPQRVKPNE